ncbi:MAG: TIM barrel protein [Maritimibacter sp.]|nr:TIM barrel protein [Maritimibacter sp.]
MTMVVTTAPACWGVDDAANPHLPDWRLVLAEAAQAGYGGLELGPYGYMPLDAGVLGAALAEHGLHIVAGTIFDDLVDPGNRAAVVAKAREICALITKLPKPPVYPGQRFAAPYLTVMDWGDRARDYAAGHSGRAVRLPDTDLTGMIETIRAVAEAAAVFGVRPVVHPHAGGHIEFEDEIDRLLAAIPAELVGLCIDTGHAKFSGMDPVRVLEKYWDRIDYLHFKDIDQTVYDRIMGERIRFFEACARGVMCPIGDGVIDYPAIHALLSARGYAGYITVEQERDPRNAAGSLEDVRKSRDYLKSAGFSDGKEERP